MFTLYPLASLFSIFAFLFGLIIGSFLNCFIWRLYKEETLGGRSYCPQCRHQIDWFDNIPVLSFLFLRGRCRHCQKRISIQYPLVELATAILFWLAFHNDYLNPQFIALLVRDWLIIVTMMIVFVYDFRWQLVPVRVVWILGAIILFLNIYLGIPWLTNLFYVAVATVFYLAQYFLTKKKGIGEGDIWLGAFLGASFPSGALLLMILVISYGLGSIISLILVSQAKKKWKSQIALGPFLAIGAIITLIWGERIISWYLGLF